MPRSRPHRLPLLLLPSPPQQRPRPLPLHHGREKEPHGSRPHHRPPAARRSPLRPTRPLRGHQRPRLQLHRRQTCQLPPLRTATRRLQRPGPRRRPSAKGRRSRLLLRPRPARFDQRRPRPRRPHLRDRRSRITSRNPRVQRHARTRRGSSAPRNSRARRAAPIPPAHPTRHQHRRTTRAHSTLQQRRTDQGHPRALRRRCRHLEPGRICPATRATLQSTKPPPDPSTTGNQQPATKNESK
jgi:hypothetical protein